MAKAAIPKLIEANLVNFLNNEGWNSAPLATAYESLGAQLPTMPFIRVEVDQGSEQPEHRGNYTVSVDVTAYGGLDPANDGVYSDITTKHSEVCGNIHESLVSELSNSDLENTATGFTGSLTVYDIRLGGFNRTIDTGNGVFEDVWSLEIYCMLP